MGRALNEGVYKRYEKRLYNEPNTKGRIDIARHIKLNRPFIGNIAFEVREHSYDNHVTQLIRHTIEHIVTERPYGQLIAGRISGHRGVINQATSSYKKNERINVINANSARISHPYYVD